MKPFQQLANGEKVREQKIEEEAEKNGNIIEEKVSRGGYKILTLLTAVNMINYADR
jgi:hypothetical protein